MPFLTVTYPTLLIKVKKVMCYAAIIYFYRTANDQEKIGGCTVFSNTDLWNEIEYHC
jgi:hypothetical protein